MHFYAAEENEMAVEMVMMIIPKGNEVGRGVIADIVVVTILCIR